MALDRRRQVVRERVSRACVRGHPRRSGRAQRLAAYLRHHQHGPACEQRRRPLVAGQAARLRLAVHARDHAARRRLGLRAARQWRWPARLVGQADAQPRSRRALGRCRPAGQARKLGLGRRHQSGRSEADLRRDRARPVFPLAGRRRELDRAAAPAHRNARARVDSDLRGNNGSRPTSRCATRVRSTSAHAHTKLNHVVDVGRSLHARRAARG